MHLLTKAVAIVALNDLGIKFINPEDKHAQQKVAHDLTSTFAIIF